MKVFLGGTCNESTWRSEMVNYLNDEGLDVFNPVVDNWDDEAQLNELYEREHCDFCLYTITPKMSGFYSIAEIIDDSNKRPEKTIFVILEDDEKDRFNKSQWKSLQAVANMAKRNGVHVFDNLKSAAVYMGSKTKKRVK